MRKFIEGSRRQPDLARVDVIKSMHTITYIAILQPFLGLANRYQNYVQNVNGFACNEKNETI